MLTSCRRIIVLLILVFNIIASADVIKNNAPKKYKVKNGDSLWDMANLYLDTPWMWSDIWKSNTNIRNSDLIFPGDTIELTYDQGKPVIFVSQRGELGRNIKLSPQIRVHPSENAIPAIHLNKIEKFLTQNIIFENNENQDKLPTVYSIEDGKNIASLGDKIFVKGDVDINRIYEVYRKGDILKDPVTERQLGVIGLSIGKIDIKEGKKQYSLCNIVKNSKEVKVSDIILPVNNEKISTVFMPKSPVVPVNAKVIRGINNSSYFSRNDSIIISKGSEEGLVEGDVLSIYKKANEKHADHLPLIPCALIMVYKTYEKVSFAIILDSTKAVTRGDLIKSPKNIAL